MAQPSEGVWIIWIQLDVIIPFLQKGTTLLLLCAFLDHKTLQKGVFFLKGKGSKIYSFSIY